MDPVRTQYEAYPYPARDPADEAGRLVEGSPGRPAEIDHYLFAGARDWSQPFRALVAGGGTGDGLIMLAQHLAGAGCPAEVVYLDLSEASRDVAEARAKVRGLTNIEFRTGSLFEAPELGRFDYIDCCGVLHHLEDPDAGFAALAQALAPDGGMGIMVYGELGRTGVYDVQQALKLLTPPEGPDAPPYRVEIARLLLGDLPDTNRFRRNELVGDHRNDEAGLYDLLLHPRDRAFRVPQILAALGRAGLRLASFVPALRYDPDLYVTDARLKARISRLAEADRMALAELLAGNLHKHIFYCIPAVRTGPAVATFLDQSVPVFLGPDREGLAHVLAKKPVLSGVIDGLKLRLPVPRHSGHLLALVDGKRSWAEIREAIDPRPPLAAFRDDARALYRVLNGLNEMVLRAR